MCCIKDRGASAQMDLRESEFTSSADTLLSKFLLSLLTRRWIKREEKSNSAKHIKFFLAG